MGPVSKVLFTLETSLLIDRLSCKESVFSFFLGGKLLLTGLDRSRLFIELADNIVKQKYDSKKNNYDHCAKSNLLSKFLSIPPCVISTTVKSLSLGMKIEMLVLNGILVFVLLR
jgi:hypothetical protein